MAAQHDDGVGTFGRIEVRVDEEDCRHHTEHHEKHEHNRTHDPHAVRFGIYIGGSDIVTVPRRAPASAGALGVGSLLPSST